MRDGARNNLKALQRGADASNSAYGRWRDQIVVYSRPGMMAYGLILIGIYEGLGYLTDWLF